MEPPRKMQPFEQGATVARNGIKSQLHYTPGKGGLQAQKPPEILINFQGAEKGAD